MGGRIEEARILIAEDDDSNLLLLRMLLENAGYGNIRATTDPRQALREIQESEPDILLLDLHMPHMSGLQLMEEIGRLAGGKPSFPIVVLSGDTNPRMHDRATALGAVEFLIKPFDVNAVLRCISSHLWSPAEDDVHGEGGSSPRQ